MALIGTLTDNFNDNSIDAAKWYNDGGANIAEVNGQLEITTTIAAGNWNIDAQDYYDLTGSAMSIKIIDAGNLAEEQYAFSPLFFFDTDSWLGSYFYLANGDVDVYIEDVWKAEQAYNADTHRYLRIRESGGNLYFDYSSDGVNWNNLYNEALSVQGVIVTDILVRIECNIWDTAAAAITAKVDDFNILPSAVTGGFMTTNSKFWG